MAIVINELVIRGTVRDPNADRSAPSKADNLRADERADLVQVCVEAVLRCLKAEKER